MQKGSCNGQIEAHESHTLGYHGDAVTWILYSGISAIRKSQSIPQFGSRCAQLNT